MCLLAISLWNHPRYRLILAANRDEFLARPTQSLHWWSDAPGLLAGRDLEGGGTWLGITRAGRLAALTNYRDPARINPQAPTRGHLVSDFLRSDCPPRAYIHHIRRHRQAYNGYNLLVGDHTSLYCYSNIDNRARQLQSGIYGLSNHLLDSPWPKTERIKSALGQVAQSAPHVGLSTLASILQDTHRPPDNDLPETGVPLDWERHLSSIFVSVPGYGTRSSSVITIAHGGRVEFTESSYSQQADLPQPIAEKIRTQWFTLNRQASIQCT